MGVGGGRDGKSLLDAEDEGVQLEAWDAEVVRDVAGVEPAPGAGEGFEWEGGHDLDLPVPPYININSLLSELFERNHTKVR
jgi:hypothetical protein